MWGQGKERYRGKETSICGCLSRGLHWAPGPQPRHVSWLGIEPATLWFTACPQSTELHQPGLSALFTENKDWWITFDLFGVLSFYYWNWSCKLVLSTWLGHTKGSLDDIYLLLRSMFALTSWGFMLWKWSTSCETEEGLWKYQTSQIFSCAFFLVLYVLTLPYPRLKLSKIYQCVYSVIHNSENKRKLILASKYIIGPHTQASKYAPWLSLWC